MEALYARGGCFGLSPMAFDHYHRRTGRHLDPDKIVRHDPDLIYVTRALGIVATGGLRLPFLDIAQVKDENYEIVRGTGERVYSEGRDVSLRSY